MGEFTLRRPLFSWFPLTFATVVWLFFWILLAAEEVTGAWLGALVVAAMITFFWTLGWGNAIRYGPTHVSVTNLLLTTRVAWTDVRSVSNEDGLTIVLRDSRKLSSIQFGGSLLGEFTGYPRTRMPGMP